MDGGPEAIAKTLRESGQRLFRRGKRDSSRYGLGQRNLLQLTFGRFFGLVESIASGPHHGRPTQGGREYGPGRRSR